MPKYTAKDVAEYMEARLRQDGILGQEEVVSDIEDHFGSEFVYENPNGNPAIDKDVLAEFKKLTPNAVWSRGERVWRPRERWDTKSRMQD